MLVLLIIIKKEKIDFLATKMYFQQENRFKSDKFKIFINFIVILSIYYK